MKRLINLFILSLQLQLTAFAQIEQLDLNSMPSYIVNARQYGSKLPETFVTMQNRNGLRIEYCVDRAMLTLWISPQAWKSMSYIDRNWSSRDDHTDVFSRIRIDGLNMNEFEGCDYDAFHSVLKYKNVKIHILNLYDSPAIVIWVEGNDCKIDFKSDRGDVLLSRTNKEFVVQHQILDRKFDFAAIIGDGGSRFGHQLELDAYRSTYASAYMKPNEILAIGAELDKENIAAVVRKIAQSDISTLLAENQKKVDAGLQYGKITMKNNPEFQKILDVNRPIALSMQDGGALRSCSQYIYYLLWVRDGGMNSSTLGLSGWTNPARDQAAYALLNPSVSVTEPLAGKYFGQLLAGNINKWEDDGLYYAVWPMFSYWSYSGDTRFLKGEYLQNLEDAVDWMERACYVKEKQSFGRFYFCENMFYNHRDFNYDNACGYETTMTPFTFKGDTVIQSHDIYINSLMYSTYLMLASAIDGPKGDEYLKKALSLEKVIKSFYDTQNALPNYGEYRLINGETALDGPYGADYTDYQWGITIPFFQPTIPGKLKNARNALLTDITNRKTDYFICGVGGVLYSMDTEIHSEDSIMKVLDMVTERSKRPGKYLPMAYTIPEMTESPDGSPFHDVRPIVYSIGPIVGAAANLAFRRLPFGISPRSTKYIDKIENIQYMGKLVSLFFEGNGPINSIEVGGKTLTTSYQLPDNWLQSEINKVTVKMDAKAVAGNILISSTVRLLDISEGSSVNYQIQGYGKNTLTFKNLAKKVIITDDNKKQVKYTSQKMDNLTYIEFIGKGEYSVRVK